MSLAARQYSIAQVSSISVDSRLNTAKIATLLLRTLLAELVALVARAAAASLLANLQTAAETGRSSGADAEVPVILQASLVGSRNSDVGVDVRGSSGCCHA
jgi:hypothetical protein